MKQYILIIMLILSVGCSKSNDTHEEGHEHETVGDRTESTANTNELPTFLKPLDPNIATIYQLAAQNPDLLKWMPCYCGCGESVGHKSNLDCFVRSISDKEIVWDTHATGCQNCLEIAIESISLKKDGKSDLEIRQYIEKKYGEDYAKPTPTPVPAA